MRENGALHFAMAEAPPHLEQRNGTMWPVALCTALGLPLLT
jgi:hypothetical protein